VRRLTAVVLAATAPFVAIVKPSSPNWENVLNFLCQSRVQFRLLNKNSLENF